MKKLLVILAGLCAVAMGCNPDAQKGADSEKAEAQTQAEVGTTAEVQWLTDFPMALEQAKKEKKLVFVDFTGSDWCGWCIRLDEEVFSRKEFAEHVGKDYVPVKIDFPRRTALPEAQQKLNEALAKKYNIEGFPTILVLDGEGKEVGRLGYVPGGPEAFIAALKRVKAPRPTES